MKYYTNHTFLKKTILCCLYFIFTSQIIFAQGEIQSINFSGLIISGDNSYGVAKVKLLIEKANTGTTTDEFGFFKMKVTASDTIKILAEGYTSQQVIIPKGTNEHYSVLIEMLPTTDSSHHLLSTGLKVEPFNTREAFTQAFLALQLPEKDDQLDHIQEMFNAKALYRMAYYMSNSPNENYRNSTLQTIQAIERKNSYTTIPLLNPFAWKKFIDSVKEGKLKKGAWKEKIGTDND